jgi:hypothetical protein
VLDSLAVILSSFRRKRVRDVRPDGLQHQVRGLIHIDGFVQSDRVVDVALRVIISATTHQQHEIYDVLVTETMILQAQGSAVALPLASIELVVSSALTLYVVVVYTNEPPRSTDRTTAVFSKDAHEGKPRASTMAESCSQHR